MFRSATFKLTSWYLAIIIAISLLFSVVIYTIASREVATRIDDWQSASSYSTSRFLAIREQQLHRAEANLIASLAITNITIWTIGGIGSYYLARRSLRPIKEAHEAQSRFTSDASHELRTPLTSMKAEIEVALRDPKLNKSEMRELLSSNLEEVDKLTKLAQTLLQLSRLDHNALTYEKLPLKKLLASVKDRFKNADRTIVISSESAHKVWGNRASIEELITILMDNAIKYSPAGSTIRITTISKKHMAGFEIVNSGPGIAPTALPHIFDRFYRVDSARSNSSKNGYGLGLSLAKKIVELHGGELTVSSAINADTTFRVLLQKTSASKRQAFN